MEPTNALRPDATNPKIKIIRQIPYYIDIPKQMVPKEQKPRLTVFKVPSGDRKGNFDLMLGINELKITIDRPHNDPLLFWYYQSHRDTASNPYGRSLIFVRHRDLKQVYRHIISSRPSYKSAQKPILPPAYIKDIYDNTIGFLLQGSEHKDLYQEYRIPFKRGVLLAGKAGSGKTLTCKWLRSLCKENDFEHSVVTMTEYDEAYRHGSVRHLFELESKGIIFFDDMDILVQARKGGSTELFSFLSFFDGMESREGIVYVFTTNLIEDLDHAFVRPGRIDLFLTFKDPTKKMRKRFINETFPDVIKSQMEIDDIVNRTKDHTFAEMEEIRKLFCFDLISGMKIDVKKTFNLYAQHRRVFQEMTLQGFSNKLDEMDEDDPWNELTAMPSDPSRFFLG